MVRAQSTCSESEGDLTTPPSPPSPSSRLDQVTRALVDQIHHAWSSNAPLSAFATIRDEVLASRSRVDVQILTLGSVAEIACPQHILADDSRWSAFFGLASACAVDIGDEPHRPRDSRPHNKRKRTDNAARRLRNLALVAALWSLDVVDYYDWSSAGNAQINLMRACALRWPRFVEDFCPRLNSVLLRRHCEAVRNSRVRGLHEVSLQPLRDLNIAALETAVVDQASLHQWTHDDDGAIPVDDDGRLLNQIRPNHFSLYLLQQDRYGLLVPRTASPAPQSPRIEASLSPFSPFPFTTYLTGSVMSDGDDNASNANATTFASMELTTNASSHHAHGSTSSSGHWTTLSTCAIVSGQGQDLGASEEGFLRQVYRPSPPQPSLDPAFLSLRRQYAYDPARQAEQCSMSDNPVGEQSPPSAGDLGSASHRGSLHPRQQVARPRPALSPSSSMFPSQRVELTVCSPFVHRQGPLTVEEAMHNKYRSTIVAYAKKISDEAECADASIQRKPRAQWLTDRTAWASFYTRSDSNSSTGGAQSYEEADVLHLTSDEFVAAASQHEVFDKPILIRERFSDSGMHTVEGLASQLIDTSPNATIDIISLDCKEVEQISIQDFVNHVRPDRSTTACGVIALNLTDVTKAHRPLFTMLPRFRLLESIANRAQEGALGKPTRPFLTDVSGSTSFNILGTSGAFSGPQLHALSGTWVRNLNGASLWMIMPESAMDAADWEAFGKLGSNWVPHSGFLLLVLEQDDVFLIPPGLKVVYAVHCLTDNVMEGAVFWDDFNVIATLQAILWIGKHQVATNEVLAHNLPRIIDELCLLVRSQVDRFLGSLLRAEFLDIFDGIVSELKNLDCAAAGTSAAAADG